MKKTTAMLLSLVLSFSLLAANALAAAPLSEQGKKSEETVNVSKGNKPKADDEKKRGLFKAYENVAGTPAKSIIANLIEQQYSLEELINFLNEIEEDLEDGTEDAEAVEDEEAAEDEEAVEDEEAAEDEEATTDEEAATTDATALKLKKAEFKAYADELREQINRERKNLKLSNKVLSDLASIYEKAGSIEDAAEMQQESVLEDIKDIESYKKLSKMYEKMGRKGVKAFVNGTQPKFDVSPIIRSGRTLVPFRAIAEALKAEVKYNAEERSVTVTRDGVVVKLFIGSTIAYVNGKEVTLDVPPMIVNGRTIVPVRFISEAFNSVVKWEAETQTVIIYEEPVEETQPPVEEVEPSDDGIAE
ncbi:MAG TPA: copper amine oxidase N-terminal domain-containing protein [Bacilli bacterium]